MEQLRKYWPYLVLLIGGTLSVLVAVISIRSFGGGNDTPATSTPREERPGFFSSLFKFNLFKPVSPSSPIEQIPEDTDSPSDDIIEPAPEETDWFPNYPLPPAELPPPLLPAPPAEDRVYLEHSVNTGSGSADDEYIILYASAENLKPMAITGMKIRSTVTGNTLGIGKAVPIYYEKQFNTEETIYLRPGGVAYIFTGRSPLDYSFRVNKCLGYLSQFHGFNPGIFTDCPFIEEKDLPKYPNHLDDDCLDYIPSLPICYEHIDPFPENIKAACQNFILERLNYGYCTANYRNAADFHLLEWRVHANRGQELWKTRREHIQLLDQRSKVIDEFSY